MLMVSAWRMFGVSGLVALWLAAGEVQSQTNKNANYLDPFICGLVMLLLCLFLRIEAARVVERPPEKSRNRTFLGQHIDDVTVMETWRFE